MRYMKAALRPLKRRALGLLLVAILGITAAVGAVSGHRYEKRIQSYVADIRAGAEREQKRVTAADYAGLPEPVQRYFEFALEEGQPYVRTARLEQRGRFRLGGNESPWYPLSATQHVSTEPPGFVWDATMTIFRVVPVRVLDMYRRGVGRLEARVFAAVPVASAGPDPEMNEAELERYLAEAAWYPTALLPAAGVEWTAIDDDTARATLEDSVTASLVFHFDDDGRIDRVTTERYRQDTAEYAPWTGYFEAYESRNGMQIPTRGEVAWNQPEGDVRYGQFTVTDIEHVTSSGAIGR